MAKKNRNTLKSYFETGKIPSQNQYADLIDSKVNLEETLPQTLAGTLTASYFHSLNDITVARDITASACLFSTVNTGQGDNNLYDMDQNVKTNSIVTFNEITSSNNTLIEGDLTVLGNTSFTNQDTTNLFLLGDLTASGNISASGYIVGQHITASGNISASGNILANKFHTNGFNVLRYKTSEDRVIIGSKFKPSHITGSSLTIGTPITGNVSASGTVYGENLFGRTNGTIGNDLFVANSIDVGNRIRHVGDTGTVITFTPGKIESTAGSISFLGNVTASGNISSSGTIIASDYTLDGVALTSTFTHLNTLDGISALQGSIVKSLNQSLSSADKPTFSGIALTKTEGFALDIDQTQTIDVGNTRSFQISFSNFPIVSAGGNSLIVSIESNALTANSVPIGCTNALLTVKCMRVGGDEFSFVLNNPTNSNTTKGTVVINFVVF